MATLAMNTMLKQKSLDSGVYTIQDGRQLVTSASDVKMNAQNEQVLTLRSYHDME